MATWQAVNINSGTIEGPKYTTPADTTELWIATVSSTVASGDVVPGPTIPAGVWLTDLVVDSDQLDSNGAPTLACEVGYVMSGTTSAAAFIASGNTTVRAGGVMIPNVGATYGFSPTANAVVQLQFTANAATGKTGKVRFKLTYNANP